MLKECRRQDVQYIPAARCVATYRLSMEEADSTPLPTIGVVEVTPTDMQHRLFTADRQLPGLALAADAAAMRERWAAKRNDQEQERATQLRAATPVRYKPGSRCTFRYDLDTAQGRKVCFGKLLARNGAQLWRTASTLHRASQQHPELPRIAAPLAYWPELQMLFQSAVPGAELHIDAFNPKLDAITRLGWLRAAGRCVAALHTYTGLQAPRRTFADDLAELDEHRPALWQANPELARRFAETIAALDESSARYTELAPVVSHGALRTDQFMIEDAHAVGRIQRVSASGWRHQLALIDLDSVCWANPARDIGNFLAYLTWKALRQPQHAGFIRCAQREFLAGYRALRTLPDVGWLSRYQAASILKIVGRRYSGLTYQEWPLTGRLLDKAVSMVQEGAHPCSN
jgi:hypothetical protein